MRTKEYFGVMLTPAVAEKLKKDAKDNERSFSFVVNDILTKEVARRERRDGKK